MSNAAADRLASVTQDLHRALEASIGNLMGAVRAAETMARRLQATEEEIHRVTRRYQQAQTAGDAERAVPLQAELAELQAEQEQQVAKLAELTSRLHG